MKFQNPILNFEWTDGRTDAGKDGQAQSTMPLQLFQSWGHKKTFRDSGIPSDLIQIRPDKSPVGPGENEIIVLLT